MRLVIHVIALDIIRKDIEALFDTDATTADVPSELVRGALINAINKMSEAELEAFVDFALQYGQIGEDK